MSEEDAVARSSNGPATVESLLADLRLLGVGSGMTLLVHSSLSSLGWVSGGPVAMVQALAGFVGPDGTLVMPTHSADLSDPARWRHPPVPESWWETIRRTMPAYDPDLTPSRKMGAIPECFRKKPGALRSPHPVLSFAAWGARAAAVAEEHPLDNPLGEHSPLARVYDLDGWVLLLGVGHGSNTSLHLAEYRAEYRGKRSIRHGAPMTVEGRRRWMEFEDIDESALDFPQIGEDFARDTKLTRRGNVACATALLCPQRPLVDYAVQWMETNR